MESYEEDRTTQFKRLRRTIAEQWPDGSDQGAPPPRAREIVHEAYEETGREGLA